MAKTFNINHENTPVKQAMPRDMRKKESAKIKYELNMFFVFSNFRAFPPAKVLYGGHA
jgi:hypothetical protein